jgi:hypothetical protein
MTTDGDDELALLTDIRTILDAVDAYAPEPSALRTDKQIAVTALNTARSLADAGQTAAKAPQVTPVIKGEQLALALRSTDLFPDRRWSEWAHGREIKSHHIIKILREYGVAVKATRLPGAPDSRGVLPAPILTTPSLAMFLSPPRGPLGDKNWPHTLTALKTLKKTSKTKTSHICRLHSRKEAKTPAILRVWRM